MAGVNPAATFAQSNYTVDTATVYKTKIDSNSIVMQRVVDNFAPRQTTSPAMTVTLDAGHIFTGTTLTEVATQTTGTITAPGGNPRIDRVVIDRFTGIASVITGTPNASPVAPAISSGKVPVCQVLIQTSSSSITNSMITDERDFSALGHGTAGEYNVGTGPNNILQLNGSSQIPAVDGSLLTGIVSIPSGVITDYAGSTAPAGWLLCYGQAISRTTFAALFTAISTTFGVGDGSTTFNIPDYRGRIGAGVDNMGGSAASRITSTSGITGSTLGSAGGEQTHVLVTGEMPSHTHTATGVIGSDDNTQSYLMGSGPTLTPANDKPSALQSTGGDGAHNNLQPTIMVNKIIKT